MDAGAWDTLRLETDNRYRGLFSSSSMEASAVETSRGRRMVWCFWRAAEWPMATLDFGTGRAAKNIGICQTMSPSITSAITPSLNGVHFERGSTQYLMQWHNIVV
jgi:hypothetical protein